MIKTSSVINTFLSSVGYDASLTVQPESVQSMLVICYLGIELVCYAAIVGLMSFLKVEKHIEADHAAILSKQKADALAAGMEWIEPAERLRREQEETERLAEASRKTELRAFCSKKGLDFAVEEAKYQARKATKRAKAEKKGSQTK